ncbi:MAG: ABC transporter permease, partial [Bacteroidota bacterium]
EKTFHVANNTSFKPNIAGIKSFYVEKTDNFAAMNISFWITNKMSGKSGGDKISKPVVNIAVAGVAIGIALIIVSLCIVRGFQKEIRDKVVGFGAHIQVLSNEQNQSRETPAVRLDQPFYPHLDTLESIANIQHFAVKPGILETNQNLQGVLIKGLGQGYNWEFFADKLVEGSALELTDTARSKQMVVSRSVANRLELELDDKVTLYLVVEEGNIRPRNFVVSGIYNTGLKEFDDQFVFIDIGHIQKINQWGVEAQIKVIEDNGIQLEGLGFGGKGRNDLSGVMDGKALDLIALVFNRILPLE